MTWRFDQVDQAFDRQLAKAASIVDTTFDPALWCLDNLNYSPFDNQIDIIEDISDPFCKYILIVGTRSGGKTDGVAAGLLKLCLENPRMSIGVFGPKLEQSIRLLKRCKDVIKHSPSKDKITWGKCTQNRIEFENGSYMLGQSANEVSMTEGGHYDVLVIDEAQKVSDLSISQKMLPMIASSRIGKVVKLGVALYKNHFWRSFKSTDYKQLIFDWTKCPNLLRGGSTIVRGREYSQYVIDRMPLNIKKEIFPENPEMWTNTSDTSEIDFRTQYLIQWQEDLNLVMSAEDQKLLISGDHLYLDKGLVTDTYYAGLDTAGGSPTGEKGNLDYTSLSIWRRTNNGRKEKVFHAEWRGNITQAINEIYEIINPTTGLFKCRFTLVDYSNIGINLVENYKELGLPIAGITFGTADRSSGKNYKNAMMDQFLYELRADRLAYPGEATDRVAILKKAQNEWHMMERHKGLGLNDKLFVPTNEGHDDAVMADLLGVWASDKMLQLAKGNSSVIAVNLPSPITVNSALNPSANGSTKPWWVEGKHRGR